MNSLEVVVPVTRINDWERCVIAKNDLPKVGIEKYLLDKGCLYSWNPSSPYPDKPIIFRVFKKGINSHVFASGAKTWDIGSLPQSSIEEFEKLSFISIEEFEEIKKRLLDAWWKEHHNHWDRMGSVPTEIRKGVYENEPL